MDDRSNILFIMSDQFRGDCLGCSGHPVVETAHLDQLAAEGRSILGLADGLIPHGAIIMASIPRATPGRMPISS